MTTIDQIRRQLEREISDNTFGIAVVNLPANLTDEQKAAIEHIANAAGEAIKDILTFTGPGGKRRAN